MTIGTQTADRKEMARALAEHLGTTARYLAMPTYAFQVGAYTVNRDGSISGEDLDVIRPFLVERGYIEATPAAGPDLIREQTAAEDSGETSLPEPATDNPTCIDLTIPAPGMTPAVLRNLFHTVYSRQKLLNHMMGADLICIPETLITRLKDSMPETPEAFTALLDDLKDSDGLDGFDYRDGKVTMTVPHTAEDTIRWEAFAGLLGRMIAVAKTAIRVTPEIPDAESEKYMGRSWLMRLGYGGQDLKAQRKELLKKLKGPSAFPNSAAAQKHKDRYAERRRLEREARVALPADSEATVTVTEGSEEAAQ